MSQTVSGSLPAGETLTLKVRTLTANSSPVATAIGVEDESLAGLYSFSVDYDGSGQHRLEVVNDDDVQLGQWLVVLAGEDGQTELMDSGSSVRVSVGRTGYSSDADDDESTLIILIGDATSDTIGNTSSVSLSLMDDGDDQIVSGTVTCKLYDEQMQELTGITNPVSLSHVANGVWTGIIGASLVYPKSRRGYAVLSVSAGLSLAERRRPVLYREEQ